jgi:hypothetical protein
MDNDGYGKKQLAVPENPDDMRLAHRKSQASHLSIEDYRPLPPAVPFRPTRTDSHLHQWEKNSKYWACRMTKDMTAILRSVKRSR